MKSQSEYILLGCMLGSMILILTQTKVSLQTKVFEQYNELAFVAQPYLAALSNMQVDTPCGKYDIYKLFILSASYSSETFHPSGCNYTVNVTEALSPLHTQFACNFGKDYYLMVYNKTQGIVINIPGNPYQTCEVRMLEEVINGTTVIRPYVVPCVVMVSQMPIPILGGNVSRVVLSRAKIYPGELDCT